jgi:acetolactate synthase-1/2/3 large subunit
MAIVGYWAAGYLDLAPRRQLLYPMGWGTLGFALPASIGAATGAMDRRTVCVVGDAGLLYAVGELATIAENQLPITVIVNDDGGYGMLRFASRARTGRAVGMDLRSPDFTALAASFGITAEAIELDDAGLAVALRKSMEGPGPSLLVIRGSLEPPRMSRLWE